MAGNPQLAQVGSAELVPAPFQGEIIVLRRKGLEIGLDGFGQEGQNRWKAKGFLYLSNVRMVFVAKHARLENTTGLQAFDIPLVYIHRDEFKQPIFGCNHLSGHVWQAAEGGGPRGSLPPVSFKLYFTEGGVGTFLPLYFDLLNRAKTAARWQEQQQRQTAPRPSAPPVGELAATAFVDPQDPTVLYLAQPLVPPSPAPPPKYAANYGQDEKYEPLDPDQGVV